MPNLLKQTNLDKLALIVTGSLVDIEILTPTTSKRIKAEFVGLLAERFIILNFPSAKRLANADEYLKEGVVVVVRAVLESGGGDVIAFRQQVLSVASHPARLLFLSYPKQVQLFSLRSQTRYPTLLPGKMILDDKREFDGIIKDISLTGIMFNVTGSHQKFTDLKKEQVTFKVEKTNKEGVEFSGQICSVKTKGNATLFGIQLLTSEGEMKTFLRNHLIDLSVLESLD